IGDGLVDAALGRFERLLPIGALAESRMRDRDRRSAVSGFEYHGHLADTRGQRRPALASGVLRARTEHAAGFELDDLGRPVAPVDLAVREALLVNMEREVPLVQLLRIGHRAPHALDGYRNREPALDVRCHDSSFG